MAIAVDLVVLLKETARHDPRRMAKNKSAGRYFDRMHSTSMVENFCKHCRTETEALAVVFDWLVGDTN